MSDNRSGGREGSPLWANVGASSTLTFNPSQMQPLLVPFNSSNANAPPVDAGEADHFLGQDSPPNLTPVASVDSSTALFAAGAGESFHVGFGNAPLTSATMVPEPLSAETVTAQPTVMVPSSHSQEHVDQSDTQNAQHYHQNYQQPLMENPPNPSRYESCPEQSFSLGPTPTTGAVPMFNPSQPMGAPPPTAPAAHYSPVVNHWFYCKQMSDQPVWTPFSHLDSMNLEEAFLNGESDVVHTDGGRYDVSISNRSRQAVYWTEAACVIRRCSWFYREDASMRYVPYNEQIAEELEEVYMRTLQDGTWHKRNDLRSSRDLFVFHSPAVFVQFTTGSFPNDFGVPFSETSRPKVVKRGPEEINNNISNGEAQQIDELVFVVHGIGPVCDLKFRGIVECVDDMRNTATSMLSSHFQTARSSNRIGRVEFLPIYWYDALRNDAVGVDKRLGKITLPSVAKIRELTNEVLLDILFYNSPLYSQSILDKVSGELNKLYKLFMERNPCWKGQVSLAGHSLGSLILFDLLSMQGVTQSPAAQPGVHRSTRTAGESVPASELTTERSRSATPSSTPVDGKLVAIETMETVLEHLALTNLADKFHEEQIDLESLLMCSEDDLKSIGLPLGPRKKILKFVTDREKKTVVEQNSSAPDLADVLPLEQDSRTEVVSEFQQHSWLVEMASNTQVGYVSGLQGVGFPLVHYPELDFHVANFFALGSPIAVFLTIRGVENLSRDFQLPTCSAMFNIFHPFDPVAYRMEPLVNPDIKQKPVLMPHHKGRKRLHLELKENIVKVGADIKDRVLRSIKSTWATINDFAKAHSSVGISQDTTADAADELAQQMDKAMLTVGTAEDKLDTSHSELDSVSSVADGDVEVGQLNQGRRIDYVLQEAPFESFNDYLFALSSHLIYWESEDVALMLMKEIYSAMEVYPDVKVKSGLLQQQGLSASPSKPPAATDNTPGGSNQLGVSYLSPQTSVSQPYMAGAAYPSQPLMASTSQPHMTNYSYPNQPPAAGVGYPSQPPMTGASYPSQPPMAGVSYPSQPPMADVSYPSQPPVAGASYLSQPPMVNASYSSQSHVTPVTHVTPVSNAQSAGPPPMSGFVSGGPPPRSGFQPRH